MSSAISLWVKIPYTVLVCVVVPVYWVKYGPANFLWGSDIALIVLVFALWMENSLLASMMAVGTLLTEFIWNLDYLARLIFGADAIPLGATRYMFDADQELWVRAASLFHVVLPFVILWILYRLGYDRRALRWQIALAWLVLPLSHFVGGPEKNINFTWGIGEQPQTWLPGPVYLVFVIVLFTVVVFMPTHLLLRHVFPTPGSIDLSEHPPGRE